MIKIYKRLKQLLLKDLFVDIKEEVKWLLPYTLKYWKYILFYIVMGVAGTGMGLAGSVASKYLIDTVTGHKTSGISFIILLMLLMSFGNLVVSAASSRISAIINLKVNNEIQAEIFDKIMNTDWECVSEYHSGDLLNRFGTDVSTIAGSVIGWIPTLITRTVQFVGTLAVILYYDATMALIALLSAPISLLMSRLLVSRMREYNKRVRQISSEMMAFSEESFQNIQIIKCFDLTGHFGIRLRGIQKKYSGISLDYNKFSIYTSSFLSAVGLGISLATFGWGVYRLWGGFITYGTMTLFLQLSGTLSGSFSSLVGMVPSAIQATTSAGRIMEVTKLKKERDVNSANPGQLSIGIKNRGCYIRLSHIDFGYKNRDQVLRNICFQASPNEIVAVIGPSGEGKTTLLRILLGLINPLCGEAILRDDKGMEVGISNATRRYFSYVPQGNTLFSGTIAENLRLVKPDATDDQIKDALIAACAYDFIQILPAGINSRIAEKGGGFSEGQIQRISIARAVIQDAPVVLLDEATSALDADTEQKVLLGIMSYKKNRTCILTTHRRSVLSMCDRVYCIRQTQMEELAHRQEEMIAVDF